jgi:hypothetical protein
MSSRLEVNLWSLSLTRISGAAAGRRGWPSRAGECQRLVFRNGLQLFGAMGFTWVNDLQIHLKRAQAGDLLLGSAAVHRKVLLAKAVLA